MRSYIQARQYIKQLGLIVSEPHLAKADAMFAEMEISEPNANRLVMLQADVMAWTMSPKSYSVWGRIVVALHFLFGIGQPK